MATHRIPTCFATLVVVQQDEKFLLIQETTFGNTWYLPAGRVNTGESLNEAAKRETLEEAGIEVELDGILKIEHLPDKDNNFVRVFYRAHPLSNKKVKNVADSHSLQAGWFTLKEIEELPLRDGEALLACRYAHSHPDLAPASLIITEGTSWY